MPLNNPILLDLTDLPNLVTHTSHTQHLTEMPPLAPCALPDSDLHFDSVPRPVLPLDGLHVRPIPVVAHQPRDQELRADAVGLREVERVLHEQRVADRLVDHAVEDVR